MKHRAKINKEIIINKEPPCLTDKHRKKFQKQYKQNNICNGIFISYWDSGAVFRAPCCINMDTRQIFNIMNVGHPSDNDSLQSETIEIEGQEYDVINIDEIIDSNSIEDAYENLVDILQNKSYWYSQTNRNLMTKIEQIRKEESY